ncbi:MAG: MoaD/ThiS family protein [Proteobacteria bacterium]|nr:MoaD/ThiS family protein [Pseudomonadota bacterium]
MKITFKLFASLAQYLPSDAVRNIVEIDVDPDTTVHEVIDRFHVPRPSAHLILINGLYVEPEDRDRPMLKAGDALAIWPPVAGG